VLWADVQDHVGRGEPVSDADHDVT
jgi:hypothetical protein